jgi:hypothetical protein
MVWQVKKKEDTSIKETSTLKVNVLVFSLGVPAKQKVCQSSNFVYVKTRRCVKKMFNVLSKNGIEKYLRFVNDIDIVLANHIMDNSKTVNSII